MQTRLTASCVVIFLVASLYPEGKKYVFINNSCNQIFLAWNIFSVFKTGPKRPIETMILGLIFGITMSAGIYLLNTSFILFLIVTFIAVNIIVFSYGGLWLPRIPKGVSIVCLVENCFIKQSFDDIAFFLKKWHCNF